VKEKEVAELQLSSTSSESRDDAYQNFQSEAQYIVSPSTSMSEGTQSTSVNSAPNQTFYTTTSDV
jgi:hypothetical protein